MATALLVLACSSSKGPDSGESDSAANDLMQKGFLLSLPENEDWTVVTKSEYKVFLSKRGSKAPENYTIQALVVSLPTFKDDNKFLDFIKKRMAKSRKKTKVTSHNTSLYSGHSETCVQYTSKEKRNSKKGKALTLELVSFICRHPDNANAGVYLALSKSYTPGQSSENMVDSATELFNRLYFTEL